MRFRWFNPFFFFLFSFLFSFPFSLSSRFLVGWLFRGVHTGLRPPQKRPANPPVSRYPLHRIALVFHSITRHHLFWFLGYITSAIEGVSRTRCQRKSYETQNWGRDWAEDCSRQNKPWRENIHPPRRSSLGKGGGRTRSRAHTPLARYGKTSAEAHT